MIGLAVTRESALKLLDTLEKETLDTIKNAAASGKVQSMPRGALSAWQDSLEERLTTIDAVRQVVSQLPKNEVLVAAEVDAARGKKK